MEISSLQAFVQVAEQGSFSLAADKLFLTQPAVSKRIATLEQELDTQLFDRIGRTVTLTEAGKALLPRAHKILEDIEDSRRQIANLSGSVKGSLRIGTSHHIGLHRLPPYLKDFTQRYDEVELDLHFMDSETACTMVSRGDLELAVVTLPSNPSPELICRTVWIDRLIPVAARDHELAGQKPISLEQLSRYPVILPGTGTFTRNIIQQAFVERGLELVIALETNYLETIHMMVSIGLGWSILPATMCADDLVRLPVADLQLSRRLGIVTHQSRVLSNAAQAFAKTLETPADPQAK
jgi:DNA-binding transcriptional LysR family regulator